MGGASKKRSKKRKRKIPNNVTEEKKKVPSKKDLIEIKKLEDVQLVITQNDIPIIDIRQYAYEMMTMRKRNDSPRPSSENDSDEDEEEEDVPLPEPPRFPVPCFKTIDNYQPRGVITRPEGYIRYIERSEEELDEEIIYDMDEEDLAWLEVVNEKRAANGFSAVSPDIFEVLMDRLEKESYFESVVEPDQQHPVKEEEALCSICNNGDSQAPNSIIFCDMCNLPVHQDCYGVPYIPEGQWLCRRCLHSPSQTVDCVLCPNRVGALKQTDRGHWAHIICALWIPEVHFANPVFLEPIYNIETILPGRWKLSCYICKQKNAGACIQCSRKNCSLAFHVTCGQLQGLYMEPVNSTEHFTVVGRAAFCDNHTPGKEKSLQAFSSKCEISFNKNLHPIVAVPTIPPERIQEISSLVMFENKSKFIKRILAYWMLKRQLRLGVPLVRRLYQLAQQVSPMKPVDIEKLREELAFWRRIRQDFERVRLLCELIRKREKKKRELLNIKAIVLEMELCPMMFHMRRLIEVIKTFDLHRIFHEPVCQGDVPGYYEYIRSPMDLSTMLRKVEQFKYANFQEFKEDFDLMINNCLRYNEKHTVYYRSAVKLKGKCTELFQASEGDMQAMTENPGIYFGLTPDGIKQEIKTEEEEEEKYIPPPPIPLTDMDRLKELERTFTAADFDKELEHFIEQKFCMTRSERLMRLDELMGMVKLIKNRGLRSKRISKLKKLIYNTKKLQKSSKRIKKKDEMTLCPPSTTAVWYQEPMMMQ